MIEYFPRLNPPLSFSFKIFPKYIENPPPPSLSLRGFFIQIGSEPIAHNHPIIHAKFPPPSRLTFLDNSNLMTNYPAVKSKGDDILISFPQTYEHNLTQKDVNRSPLVLACRPVNFLLPLFQEFQSPHCFTPTRPFESQKSKMSPHDGTSFEGDTGEATRAFSFMEIDQGTICRC